jgi:hypothetical protein
MESREMGQMWATHYQKRHINPDSRHICKLICSLVRAEATIQLGRSFNAALAEVLDKAGIPIEQFDACESEGQD